MTDSRTRALQAAYEAQRAFAPHQAHLVKPPKKTIDSLLDHDLRSENCEGTDHARLLANILRVLRSYGQQQPTEAED